MSDLHVTQQATQTSSAGARTPEGAPERGGLRGELRGMSYAEGAAALAPVQLKEGGGDEGAAAAGKKTPIPATFIQLISKERDEAHYTWHETVLIGRGKNAELSPGMLVTAQGGAYKGAVSKVFPTRAYAKFFGGYPAGEKNLVVERGKEWSYGAWLAQQKAGTDEAEKAGSTKHGKQERGGQ